MRKATKQDIARAKKGPHLVEDPIVDGTVLKGIYPLFRGISGQFYICRR